MISVTREHYFLTGLDEAGYGPMLGPLVVGLATLESPREISAKAPWKLLAPTVAHRSKRNKLAIADSKLLHRPSTGDLSPLELGVLSFVACELGSAGPASFRELIAHVTEGRSEYLDDYPWYRDRDLALPVSVDPLVLSGSVRRLERALERTELAIAEVRALPIEVIEFNDRLAQFESNKAEVNAWAMGRFLSWIWSKRDRERILVATDRLGGRTRYGPFLYPLFPDAQLQIVEQQNDVQIYRVTQRPRRELTVSFKKGGEEESFTTALASMTAKYVRELHMRLFNDWWREQYGDELKATAGYPQDARRFLGDIDALRDRLGIGTALLIRKR